MQRMLRARGLLVISVLLAILAGSVWALDWLGRTGNLRDHPFRMVNDSDRPVEVFLAGEWRVVAPGMQVTGPVFAAPTTEGTPGAIRLVELEVRAAVGETPRRLQMHLPVDDWEDLLLVVRTVRGEAGTAPLPRQGKVPAPSVPWEQVEQLVTIAEQPLGGGRLLEFETAHPVLPRAENFLGMQFLQLPAGTFRMRAPEDPQGPPVAPQETFVRLSRPFWIGVRPVTIAQWNGLMGPDPAASSASSSSSSSMQGISWDDAEEFCRRLSAREGRTYRLPTEAEWEYACRAGAPPRIVGPPFGNRWGLAGIRDGREEWCFDWCTPLPPLRGPLTDPTGPPTGTLKLALRAPSGQHRDCFRVCEPRDALDGGVALRVVLEDAPEAPQPSGAAAPGPARGAVSR
ncbi:MAG: formylglycine-generating enzyme family protein [Phycisphaerales bacterium]